MDARITAIRADKRIGEGTCSTVDECYTDQELVAELDAAGITEPAQAVNHFRELEGLRNQVEDDIRGYGDLPPLHGWY